jgi:RNA polymerase sigma-70 factor (ECF subfamily)
MTEFADSEWVDRLASEDAVVREEAASLLHLRLARYLHTQLVKRGVSEDCVADVVQESVLRVLDRLHTFRGDSRFISWATAVGVRTGMELIRRQYWKTQSLGDLVKNDDVDLTQAWETGATASGTEGHREEILAVLSDLIQDALTDRQRLVLLAEIKGMPSSEIARELGSTRGAIYKVGHDARKRLKAELERRGIDASLFYSSINSG